ncbi:hypothetical protein BDP55DRAFT_672490 [Colletotrichum godetiae]|uniref:Uncharacterized protein n=1 Tax=Colletotrichum godetiae TaxID=1209918 RepID=A0AAJ0ERH0_9PEZI|nr:uncharacterized protein BDP55DRAFT_672490 [Colletotrichum godetiae]KAK1672757.1 hypothetical protein BDP55DRAFT_672490 [Colletotrichum godetiae]
MRDISYHRAAILEYLIKAIRQVGPQLLLPMSEAFSTHASKVSPAIARHHHSIERSQPCPIIRPLQGSMSTSPSTYLCNSYPAEVDDL